MQIERAQRKAPEGWRTPGRYRDSKSVGGLARFWTAAALRRFRRLGEAIRLRD